MAIFYSEQEKEIRAQLGEPTLTLTREQVARIVLSEIRATVPALGDGAYMAFSCLDGGMQVYRVPNELIPTTEPEGEFVCVKPNEDTGELSDISLEEWEFAK